MKTILALLAVTLASGAGAVAGALWLASDPAAVSLWLVIFQTMVTAIAATVAVLTFMITVTAVTGT